MTSSIINFIVEKYLSNIVEINPEKTKSSLWSGTFEMSNLKIKKEIFQTIDLPYCELVNGYIGNLKIKIQLPRFYLYPIQVYIDKVFFHAKQKQLDKLNKNDELQGMENYKKSKLQSAEEFKCELTKLASEEPGMVTQMINNVQITINDICVRFDDEISCPEIPFTFGILMKSLFVRTTNSTFEFNENENVNIPYGEINHKIIRLNNLSMYLDTFKERTQLTFQDKIIDSQETKIEDDIQSFLGEISTFYKYCLTETKININNPSSHQYLLYGLGLTLKTSLNENLQNGSPKAKAVCNLDPLTTSIGVEQIYTLLKLLAYINLNSLYRTGLAKEYYVKTLTNEEKIEYIKKYIDYYNYQYQKETLNPKEAKNLKTILESIEQGLTYDQIQILREGAMIQIDYNKNMKSLENEISDLKKNAAGSKWNPMSYFSSGPSKEQQQQMSLLLKKKKELKQEQTNIDKQIEEILKREQSLEIDFYRDLKDSFILYQIDFTMTKCVMNILENKTVSMIELIFDNLQIKGDMKKKGQFFSLYISDIQIFQKNLPDSPYQTLMETVSDFQDEPASSIIKDNNEIDGAIYIEFENDPALEKSNYRFKFRNTKQLVITLNLYSIQYLSNRVLTSLKSSIDRDDLQKYAVGEVNKYISAGYDNVLSGNYQHFNIDLDINVKSPIMLMPQNICDLSNKSCILIRFGDLVMKSILPPRPDAEHNYLTERNKDLMYDIYELEGKNFYLLTMEDFSGNIKEFHSARKNYLIKDVTIKFTMANLIEAKNPYFENVNINLSIENVRFTLRDTQIVFLMNFLDGFTRVSDQLTEELEKAQQIEINEQNVINENENENNNIQKEGRQKELELAHMKDIEENPVGDILKQSLNEKVDKTNKKEKIFFHFYFVLTDLEFSILKTVQSSEREILLKSNVPEIHNKEYKEYLTFYMDSFSIDVKMTDKTDMIINLQIYSLSLTDYEVRYTSEQNANGESVIHSGFQRLISSISKDDEMKRRGKPIISNNNDNINISQHLIKADEESKRFMNIVYKFNSTTKETNIDMSLQNLYLILNYDTLAGLYQFYQYYMGFMSNNQKRYMHEKNLKIQSKVINFENDIINNNDISNNDILDVNNKHIQRMEVIHPNGEIEYNLIETQNNKANTKKLLSLLKKRFDIFEDNTDITKEQNIIRKEEQSKMSISFSMKNVEMYLPLDPTKSNTTLMNFTFNFLTNINMHSKYTSIYSRRYFTLLKMNYSLKEMKMSMKIYDISFDIINYTNNIKIRHMNSEKMLSNFRIHMNIDQFLIDEEHKNVMAILFSLEPITTVIGFREIKKIQQFLDKSMQFLTNMNKPYEDPLKTYNKEEFIRMSSYSSSQLLEDDEDNKTNKKYKVNIWKEAETLDDSFINTSSSKQKKKVLRKVKVTAYTKQELLQKIQTHTDKDIYNINTYNNQMDFTCNVDKISLKFIDNTANMNILLLNIEANKISFKYISNSNSNNVDNLANVLVESLTSSNIDFKEYDLLDLYQYMDCYFNMEINFFNDKVNDWEPIMEPWNASVKLIQVGKYTTMKIDFNSDTMFNLNFSVYSVKVFNSVMKKLQQDESEWKEERKLSQSEFNVMNRSGVKIINKTGEKIIFKLGVDKMKTLMPRVNSLMSKQISESHKNDNNIKGNVIPHITNSFCYNLDELDRLNRKYTDQTTLLVKKDKISFGLKEFAKIYNHDFSYYHYSTYLLRDKHLKKQNATDTLSNSKYSYDLESQFSFKTKPLEEPLITELVSKETNNFTTKQNIGVTVKTILNGLTKEVILESNISFYNNLHFPIRLCFIANDTYVHKYMFNDSAIDFGNEIHLADSFEIAAQRHFALPLKYIISKHRVYSSIDNGVTFKVVYDNFDFINEELMNVIKYDEAISFTGNNNKEYNHIKAKGLEDKSSRVLMFNKENKPYHVTVDMMIHRGMHDKVELKSKSKRKAQTTTTTDASNDNTNNTNNNNNKLIKTYSYYFIFNQPLILENKVPYKLNIEILQNDNNNNNKDDIINTESTSKYITINELALSPLELKPIDEYDPSDNSKGKFKISMQYHNTQFISQNVSIINSLDKKTCIELTDTSNENNKLNLYVEINDNDIQHNVYPGTYLKLIKNFTKRKHFTFYFEYIVVNKTNKLLLGKDASIKDENIINESFNGKFFPKSVSLFTSNKPTIQIKETESEWFKAFNVSTFGMSGEISLSTTSVDSTIIDANKRDTIINDYAVRISNSSYFTRSTILILEHRFMLFNETSLPIHYKQYDNKQIEISNRLPYVTLETKENTVLSFIKTDNKFNRMIQISLDQRFVSSAFKIDEIQDIDIKIPINDNTIITKLHRLNEEIANENKIIKQENENKLLKDHTPLKPKYHMFNQGMVTNLIIRATVQSYDNGLIYIILHNPQYPEYQIKNETNAMITVHQKNSSFGKEETTIPPGEPIPYAWSDMLQDEKMIICNIKYTSPSLQMQIEDEMEIQFGNIVHLEKDIGHTKFYMDVVLENKNKTRTFVIRNDNKVASTKKENLFKIMTGKRRTHNMRFNMNMKGIGVSIIDNVPREVFYISIYGIDIVYLQLSYTKDRGVVDTVDNLQLHIKNFQIDYCLDDSFKSIIFPKEPINPRIEEVKVKKKEIIVPFVQVLFTRHMSYNPLTKGMTTNYPQIDLILQEFNVKVDLASVMTLLNLQSDLLNELDFYAANTTTSSVKANEEGVSSSNIILSDDNSHNSSNSSNSQLLLPSHYDPFLTCDIDKIDSIIHQSENPTNVYINQLKISAMKINLTFRLDFSIINVSLLPGIINKVIASLGNSLTHISDSPLRFSEMIHVNVFGDTYKMTYLVIEHYKRQALLEAYKIIGSLDLIGNPIGFVHKIGTGFIEFFNEPRKAFLQGPSHFPQGIEKGVTSLVTNVVGGGFDVVGKITGTLLSAAKTIQGEKIMLREEDEPDNVILGIYEGLKGGAKDIYSGITGLFRNPYENAKKSGVKGFFKGIGTGIVGAVVSPISAALRVGNSVVVGMKNTVNMLSTKVKNDRFRYPRTMNSITALKPYDEASAIVHAMLKELNLFDDDEKVVYFKEEFTFMEFGLDDKNSTIIMTDKNLMVIYDFNQIVFEVAIEKVKNMEIHYEKGNTNDYVILFILNKGNKKYIKTKDMNLCCELFSIFDVIVDKDDTPLGTPVQSGGMITNSNNVLV